MNLSDEQITEKDKIEKIMFEIEDGYGLNIANLKGFYEKYKVKVKHFNSWEIGTREKANDGNGVINQKRQIKINIAVNSINKAIDVFEEISKKRQVTEYDFDQILEKQYKDVLYNEAREWKTCRDRGKKNYKY